MSTKSNDMYLQCKDFSVFAVIQSHFSWFLWVVERVVWSSWSLKASQHIPTQPQIKKSKQFFFSFSFGKMWQINTDDQTICSKFGSNAC